MRLVDQQFWLNRPQWRANVLAGVAGTAGRHDVASGVVAALRERLNMILRQASLAAPIAVGAAMAKRFLYGRPLCVSEVIDRRTSLACATRLRKLANLVRMLLTPLALGSGRAFWVGTSPASGVSSRDRFGFGFLSPPSLGQSAFVTIGLCPLAVFDRVLRSVRRVHTLVDFSNLLRMRCAPAPSVLVVAVSVLFAPPSNSVFLARLALPVSAPCACVELAEQQLTKAALTALHSEVILP